MTQLCVEETKMEEILGVCGGIGDINPNETINVDATRFVFKLQINVNVYIVVRASESPD